MPETSWLAFARLYIGLREIPGKLTNTTIAGWLQKLKAPWRDDSTPWCGVYVAACFDSVGIKPVKGWAGARNWLNFGVDLSGPRVGCVVVFWRGSPKGWSGHVGFVVGKDAKGNLMVLGGNQGNAVSIKPFSRDRVLGYRWPAVEPLPPDAALPVLTSDGALSNNEA
jgi:uncharacterized protein (TIGR02594 family)